MKARLVSYNGSDIPVGDTATLDSNYPVTVTAVRPPSDDDDNGRVSVSYEWGATQDVDPVRLRAYITS